MSTASELPAVTNEPSIGMTKIPSRPLLTLNDAATGEVIELYQMMYEIYMNKIITLEIGIP